VPQDAKLLGRVFERRVILKINIEESTQRFREKFFSLGFNMDQSQNKAPSYKNCKEERDTQAVRDFLKTETFEYIKKMK